MKVNMIFFNLSGWKRTWKTSGLTGNRTLTFVVTGRSALSIDLIMPTRGQTRVDSRSSLTWDQAQFERFSYILSNGETKIEPVLRLGQAWIFSGSFSTT